MSLYICFINPQELMVDEGDKLYARLSRLKAEEDDDLVRDWDEERNQRAESSSKMSGEIFDSKN
ncbi:hypothetical protein COLO4_08990 [Corchorus olitorius]|uniref:Uncharacterized protein n=1 Tax=Corchorus olitorius TaxID=93759 RepID=A0A1R3KDU5_9ROSI|nr:hypothetical protein COLO4_08990 [Corchorus olitorius]